MQQIVEVKQTASGQDKKVVRGVVERRSRIIRRAAKWSHKRGPSKRSRGAGEIYDPQIQGPQTKLRIIIKIPDKLLIGDDLGVDGQDHFSAIADVESIR